MAEQVTLSNRYRLEGRPIGNGGMGDVWLARDLRLERTAVVKLIRLPGDTQDESLIQRFKREAKLTAQMEHPGVPAIYDYGVRDDGRPFIVMQRIHGIDVDHLLADHGPLSVGWVAAIGAQVSSVLMAAHAAGLIHRDIKPGNLMLERSGAIKVLDFGVAGVFGRNDISKITRTGEGLGTPQYMAPEQFLGIDITPSADIYGLGCTLYELLLDAPPFAAETSHKLMDMHLNVKPRALREQRDDVPPGLEALILAMLEKQPLDRPASAIEVCQRLVEFIGELPDLPEVLAPASDPIRAYVALGGRLLSGETQQPQPNPVLTIDRARLSNARDRVMQLLDAARFEDAAQELASVVEPAAQAFGPLDSDVLDIRAMQAAILYEAGQFRPAVRKYRMLADDLAQRYGPDDSRVLDCRREAARAHLELGESTRAKNQLTQLMRDHIRIYGSDHESVRVLRQEIDQLGR